MPGLYPNCQARPIAWSIDSTSFYHLHLWLSAFFQLITFYFLFSSFFRFSSLSLFLTVVSRAVLTDFSSLVCLRWLNHFSQCPIFLTFIKLMKFSAFDDDDSKCHDIHHPIYLYFSCLSLPNIVYFVYYPPVTRRPRCTVKIFG